MSKTYSCGRDSASNCLLVATALLRDAASVVNFSWRISILNA